MRNLLRGQPNTVVKVTVKREGTENPLTFELTRADIKIKNVPFYGMIDKETGYIALTGFTQGAGKEVSAALKSLKAIPQQETPLCLRVPPAEPS